MSEVIEKKKQLKNTKVKTFGIVDAGAIGQGFYVVKAASKKIVKEEGAVGENKKAMLDIAWDGNTETFVLKTNGKVIKGVTSLVLDYLAGDTCKPMICYYKVEGSDDGLTTMYILKKDIVKSEEKGGDLTMAEKVAGARKEEVKAEEAKAEEVKKAEETKAEEKTALPENVEKGLTQMVSILNSMLGGEAPEKKSEEKSAEEVKAEEAKAEEKKAEEKKAEEKKAEEKKAEEKVKAEQDTAAELNKSVKALTEALEKSKGKETDDLKVKVAELTKKIESIPIRKGLQEESQEEIKTEEKSVVESDVVKSATSASSKCTAALNELAKRVTKK